MLSDKYDAKCAGKGAEQQSFKLTIPNSIFISEEEEARIKVPLKEKQLSYGPSSSISGKLFKVMYVCQFSLKHDVMGASQKTMPDAQIPIMIMTPAISLVAVEKLKIKQHPNWQPYSFEAVECWPDTESEDKNEYAKFRKWLIKKEQDFVAKQIKKIQEGEVKKKTTEEVKTTEVL